MIYQMEEVPLVVSDEEKYQKHGLEDTSENNWTQFNEVYPTGEIVWGVILLFGILIVNSSVLWVIGKSRSLWKPRHLWIACLCVTDLFVGAHKGLELFLLTMPQRELCVLQRTTLGIPYVVNMLLLTLLSLDRLVAVKWPFFYTATVSNKHVLIGFILVLMAGSSLAAVSVVSGLKDPICRAQSIQLVYLTIVLTICSILTLLFNSSVLRTAKKQLNAIYAHEPVVNTRRVSLFCQNCGHKNATYVNTLTLPNRSPINNVGGGALNDMDSGRTKEGNNNAVISTEPHQILPITAIPVPLSVPLLPSLPVVSLPEPIVLSPIDLDTQFHHHHHHNSYPMPTSQMISDDHVSTLESTPLTMSEPHYEAIPPLIRTISLPTLPPEPIPNPTIPTTALLIGSTAEIMDTTTKLNSSMTHLNTAVDFPHAVKVGLPRSRSFTIGKKAPVVQQPPRHHLFRSLHFTRSHMFHVGRLFPSIRFARTVLLIMVPMWIFLLPIVTIIPLHRGCIEGNNSDLNCTIVNKLWAYLLIHMRSVLPLQAILDTLIYACGSKEFRHSWVKLFGRKK